MDEPIVDWRSRAAVAYPLDAQRAYRVKMALAELDNAIATLHALGFPIHVMEGPAPAVPAEWPKMVFHLRCGERTVQSQLELDELGPDWYGSMEDARHAAGMSKQMQRGGVFDGRLPAMPGLGGLGMIQQADAAPHDSTAANLVKEEFLERRRKSNGAAQERQVKESDL